jgi:hypothetical protein
MAVGCGWGFSHYLPSLPLLLRFELRQRAHSAFDWCFTKSGEATASMR